MASVSKTNPRIRGAKPAWGVQLTTEVAARIGGWIAMGMPIRLACIKERVHPEAFESARHEREDINAIVDESKADFMAEALGVMRDNPKGHRGYEFILERRHPEFARNAPTITTNITNNSLLIPDSTLDEIRAIAQARFTVPVKRLEEAKA